MTIQTRESILSKAEEITSNHECPYKTRLDRVRTSLISITHLSILVDDLQQIHEGDVCPPTHLGTSPTALWSDWVEDTAQ